MTQGFVNDNSIPLPVSVLNGGTGVTTSTGTGSVVLNNSPTFVTPDIAAALADSIQFNNYATGGILGTTTNNDAATGYVGEFKSTQVLYAARINCGATTVAKNLTSVSLTAGDWDVYGNIFYILTAVCTGFNQWFNDVSATQPDISYMTSTNIADINGYANQAVRRRFSLSVTTDIYLSCSASYTGAIPTMCGGIYARRVR